MDKKAESFGIIGGIFVGLYLLLKHFAANSGAPQSANSTNAQAQTPAPPNPATESNFVATSPSGNTAGIYGPVAPLVPGGPATPSSVADSADNGANPTAGLTSFSIFSATPAGLF